MKTETITKPDAGREAGDTNEREARLDLAAAHRLAVRDGLSEGTWNHFTLVHPDDPDRMLLSPSYTHWSQVTASNLVDVGGEYERRGDSVEWTAYRIHRPLHEARPDAACAMHIHSPSTVALSMLSDCRLLMAEQNALAFSDRVAYTDEYDGLWPASLDHGRRLADTLGDNTVLMMRNHGALVVGPTVARTYTELYLLDRACQALVLALSTGREINEVPVDRSAVNLDWEDQMFYVEHFAAMRRLLDRDEPDYSD
jgi:ribulose-5-phosphate 4-epimerase/fuculose-1-phosphate aldolase